KIEEGVAVADRARIAHGIAERLTCQAEFGKSRGRADLCERRFDLAAGPPDLVELLPERGPDLLKLRINIASAALIQKLRLNVAETGSAELIAEMGLKLAFAQSTRCHTRRVAASEHILLQPSHGKRRDRDLLAMESRIPARGRHHFEMVADEM